MQGVGGLSARSVVRIYEVFCNRFEVLENGCCFSTTHVLIEGELSET